MIMWEFVSLSAKRLEREFISMLFEADFCVRFGQDNLRMCNRTKLLTQCASSLSRILRSSGLPFIYLSYCVKALSCFYLSSDSLFFSHGCHFASVCANQGATSFALLCAGCKTTTKLNPLDLFCAPVLEDEYTVCKVVGVDQNLISHYDLFCTTVSVSIFAKYSILA